jgi:cholesterol oxidase
MAARFDVIVIGSGFGGAATAARLAEGGARVLVLERGRRWTKDQYPRTSTDPWVYHEGRPQKQNGWLDLRFFRRMIVVQGAGVGGGSLCYSSVVMEANPELFAQGWPEEVTFEELRPYYDRVGAMLKVRPIPVGQMTARARLLEQAADRLGYQDRFSRVPLALTFDDEWTYDLPDPLNERHSKPWVNEHGLPQGTCVHLGNCDIGCDVGAKNTLDLNYIPFAERHGAEVRPMHVVRNIEPDGRGYRVVFDRIEGGRFIAGSERAEKVVIAAGSLGTTELLLRCRDVLGSLPHVSRRLGKGWSPNANFLTPDRYPDDGRVRQGIGPTISAGLEFMDGAVDGEQFFIEDDGFPDMLANALRARLTSPAFRPLAWMLQRDLKRNVDAGAANPFRNVMLWLGEGIDASDGELRLKRRATRPWRQKLDLDWDVSASRGVAEAILGMHRRLSESAGGRLYVPLYWRLLKGMVSVHPLGGAGMGKSRDDGVVNHAGEVFGHPNLYVADGAMLPGAVGRNPSMTIGALGERVAALILEQ